ncbi:hypothetical protein PCANC_26456 [Puccinia coronata f. sp. avenae]|uniref:DUF4219 domain-containing protein n=1 Tax=Puccinia coronata f. sp. avenae TaxID=200324 RepID=A0A2N5RZA7_9BASI|nr:hypothetical protein PCANC_26456 [Puccinia coronata f. sp. avenae]
MELPKPPPDHIPPNPPPGPNPQAHIPQPQPNQVRGDNMADGARNGFRQAMLKTALETIPQLTEENYSIWKDKLMALLKLRGVLNTLNNADVPLGESDNAELTLLIISKMESVTHNNVVTAKNRDSAQKLWASIKE